MIVGVEWENLFKVKYKILYKGGNDKIYVEGLFCVGCNLNLYI